MREPVHVPRVSISNATAVTIALYVRDRYAPALAAEVPRLSPPVAPEREATDVDGPSWLRWWDSVLAAQAGVLVPPRQGPLRDLHDRHLDIARIWGEPQVDEAIAAFTAERNGVAALIERWSPQESHAIDVVSMEAPWARVLSAGRLVVSTATLAGPAMLTKLSAQLGN